MEEIERLKEGLVLTEAVLKFEQDRNKMLTDLNKKLTKQLTLKSLGYWVAVESKEQPEKCTEVIVMYKDGRKAVALFDRDGRFYIERDDWDITNIIVKWHRLP